MRAMFCGRIKCFSEMRINRDLNIPANWIVDLFFNKSVQRTSFDLKDE